MLDWLTVTPAQKGPSQINLMKAAYKAENNSNKSFLEITLQGSHIPGQAQFCVLCPMREKQNCLKNTQDENFVGENKQWTKG